MKKEIYLEEDANENNRLLKRIGILGFAFFAIKGIFWLIFVATVGWYGVN